jgi:hypothetical protein
MKERDSSEKMTRDRTKAGISRLEWLTSTGLAGAAVLLDGRGASTQEAHMTLRSTRRERNGCGRPLRRDSAQAGVPHFLENRHPVGSREFTEN